MRPEQDDTQASELQCFQDLYDIYIGTKKKWQILAMWALLII